MAMRNGKGSLQRPIGRISDAEMRREWKRIFGRKKRPRNKRAAIEAMRSADVEPTAKLTPEQFVERERANSAALGLTEGTPRVEELRHTIDCRCYACAPRSEPGVEAPAPAMSNDWCAICGAATEPGVEECVDCTSALAVAPLAPVTPDVPNQAPVAVLGVDTAALSPEAAQRSLQHVERTPRDRPHKIRRG